MSTVYAKVKVGVVVSPNSDYSDPDVDRDLDPYEVQSEGFEWFRREASTSSETFVCSQFSTIDLLVIKNEDASNYVTITHRSAGNSSTDNKHRIGPGKFLVLPDVTPSATTFTHQASGAACILKIGVLGET